MMMKSVTIAACLLASPAWAITVSNLDVVPHKLVLEEVQGSKLVKVIQPNETIRSNAGAGKAYLLHKPQMAVHIEELDRLVIWQEGSLQLQMRRQSRGR